MSRITQVTGKASPSITQATSTAALTRSNVGQIERQADSDTGLDQFVGDPKTASGAAQAAAGTYEANGADAVQIAENVLPGVDVVEADWHDIQAGSADEELQFFKGGQFAGVADHVQSEDGLSAKWHFASELPSELVGKDYQAARAWVKAGLPDALKAAGFGSGGPQTYSKMNFQPTETKGVYTVTGSVLEDDLWGGKFEAKYSATADGGSKSLSNVQILSSNEVN